MRRNTIISTAVMAAALTLTPVAAQAWVDDPHEAVPPAPTSATEVLCTTIQFHWIPSDVKSGSGLILSDAGNAPTCFEGERDGSVHFIHNVDALMDSADPEAMVYEVAENGRLEFVGVGYVVPPSFADDESGDAGAAAALSVQRS